MIRMKILHWEMPLSLSLSSPLRLSEKNFSYKEDSLSTKFGQSTSSSFRLFKNVRVFDARTMWKCFALRCSNSFKTSLSGECLSPSRWVNVYRSYSLPNYCRLMRYNKARINVPICAIFLPPFHSKFFCFICICIILLPITKCSHGNESPFPFPNMLIFQFLMIYNSIFVYGFCGINLYRLHLYCCKYCNFSHLLSSFK